MRESIKNIGKTNRYNKNIIEVDKNKYTNHTKNDIIMDMYDINILKL